jgi:hypothetical protein
MNEPRVTPHLEDVRTAEIPEVLRVASELYARDRAELERAAQHRELLKAAAEAGLPPEYLDRAAAALHARRLARADRQRRWQAGSVAALALAAMALALGVTIVPTRTEVQLLTPDGYYPSEPPLVERSAIPASPPPAVALASRLMPVDLSGQVTHSLDQPMLDTPGNDLSDLGPGFRTFAGVQFRPEGVVLVGPGQTGGQFTDGPVAVPREIDGIPIDRKARRLYFLQGTHFSADPGSRIGAYVVHYRDGTTAEIPIRYGDDVLDWWANPGAGSGPAQSQIVWTGHNEAASRSGVDIRLFMKTWINPHPERVIETLDMVTGDQPPGPNAPSPFLVGVTTGW